MRIGIYGGSFDPVHYGHLLLAESCREQVRLDQVWFLPAAAPPHKRAQPITPAKDRVEMLRLAIGGHGQFLVSTLEIDRGGVSYTVDTLTAIRAERPGDELFLLLGADTLHDLPHWREPAAILELATPVVVQRSGSPSPDFSVLEKLVPPGRLVAFRQHAVEMPLIALSSTDLRARASQGQSLRYRTPRAVEKYIESQGLYRTSISLRSSPS